MAADELRIAVFLEDGFDDDEVRTLTAIFEAGGVGVSLVAPFAQRPYAGRHGRLSLTSELAASKVRSSMFSAIVIPGGYAADRLRMRHAVLDLVRDGLAQGIPVAAMGHGPQVLISAAVVAGRTMTCWPSIAIDIKNAGALYVDRPVVDDGGIITARKTADARMFAEAILKRIDNSR